MPAPMPGHVAKGDIIERLQDVMNTKRAELLVRLKDHTGSGWKEDLVDIGVDMVGLNQVEEDHLRDHWFAHRGGWWPRAQPLDDIVRVGLIRAMEIAEGLVPEAGPQKLPIDCYWVCSAGSSASVTSCVSDHQVTTLIFTPPPPVSDYLPGPWGAAEKIFTAQRRSAGAGYTEIGQPLEFIETVQPHKP